MSHSLWKNEQLRRRNTSNAQPRSALRRYAPAALLFLVMLIVLEWALPALGVPPYLLPTPSRVLRRLGDPESRLFYHLAFTAMAGISGLLLGMIVAFLLALAFIHMRLVEDTFYPWVLVSQTIPAAALAPLFTIWLGNGLAPRIATAALFAFFPILVSTTQGMRRVSQEELALLRSWGASKWQILRLLRLPSSLPSFFAGLKIAATLAMVGAIVGELAGGNSGLGYIISVASYRLQTDRIFAAVALTAGTSLLLYLIISLAERRIVFWEAHT